MKQVRALRHLVLTLTAAFAVGSVVAGPAMAQDNASTPASSAQAQSAASANAAALGAKMEVRRIGLIDMDGVLRASTGISRVRELLDEQRDAFQKEFAVKEASLQETERQLLLDKSMLSEDAFQIQLAAFQEDVAKLQQQIQYRRQALDVAFQDAQNDLRGLALEIVKEIAGERSLDLVLVKGSALIYVPVLNISDEVLKRLNERTKNARIEIEVDEKTGN